MKPRTYRVGIRLPDWNRGYGNRLFGGIRDFIQAGHSLALEFDQPSANYFEPVRIGADWQGDGLLVYRYSADEAKAWRKRGIPVVNLSTEQPDTGPRFPRVTLDNEEAGRIAAKHLGSLGVQKFAFWHDSGRQYSRERLAGFQSELANRDRECTVLEVPASKSPIRTRARVVAKLGLAGVSQLQAPCGLFAKDDLGGVSAIRALKTAELRCPHDVAVLGVSDDIVHCHLISPGLSSLRFPGKRLGFTAARLLYRMMEGARVERDFREQILSPGVVQRGSTEFVELPDPVVSQALQLIRREAPSGRLTTQLLCSQAGFSRELMRQRFQECLGRSMKQEIDRIRGEHVGEVLRQNDQALEQVAGACGFGGADELCRFFKRVKGMTPSEWRGRYRE
ncbi:MAG: substrate-binding domain-containing protein [Verrucomicrobiota bacterium]